MAPRNLERIGYDLAERGALIVPCPRVSRAGAVFSADGARVAREVGVGPARVLVSWAGGGELGTLGGPRAYRIETSAGSRDGSDGEWREELSVLDNAAPARAHVVEFDGQSWVRMTIDPVVGEAPSRVPHFDIHDASDGTEDSWLVLGDGLAESAFALEGRELEGNVAATFAEVVHDRYPGYFPAVINEGRGGEAVAQTLARLPALLALHAHARHALLVYGDPRAADAEGFGLLVRALLEAERVPVIMQLSDAALAAQLEARYDLVPGPDLRGVLAAPPGGWDVALTTPVRSHIHRLLADALDVLYVPH